MFIQIHPCCGWSLQTGVKIVVIFEIMTSIFLFFNSLALIVVALGLYGLYRGGSLPVGIPSNPYDIPAFQFWSSFPNITNTTNMYATPNLAAGLAICGMVLFLTSFITLLLSSKLWKGAECRNIEKCQTWLIIRSILVLISAASFISELFFGIFSSFFANGASALFSRTGAAAQIILNIYCLWIVLEFIQELKTKRRGGLNFNYGFQNVAKLPNDV